MDKVLTFAKTLMIHVLIDDWWNTNDWCVALILCLPVEEAELIFHWFSVSQTEKEFCATTNNVAL